MTQFSKIPTEPHFAVLTTSTTHVPGDARWQQTGGGHGYGPEDVENIHYEAFGLDQTEAMNKRIEQLIKNDENFRVQKVTPMKVSTELHITFKE